ncbi:unnamed protein product [Rhizophagus irregularis]|nr:unnamed protein product [Rhizophagus irregularis]
MKNVATEFAKRRENLQQLYIKYLYKNIQMRVVSYFESRDLILMAAQIENKLLMEREDHSSAISNRPGENSKT